MHCPTKHAEANKAKLTAPEKRSLGFFRSGADTPFFQPKLSLESNHNSTEKKDLLRKPVREKNSVLTLNSGENDFFQPMFTNGSPDVQKQDENGGGVPSTPCPTSVSIGRLAPFNHSSLPASQKDNWGTYLGVASQMNVGPGPDHSGHCMKETLATVSNNCPAQVYQREGRATQPCTGNKCLDINRYGNAGDGLTGSTVPDGPTSFLDLHRTRNRRSLLEGAGSSSCSVVCEQTYTCDRTQATTGRFRITRNYQAGTHTKADGTNMHITTGNVRKEVVT
jgi:hypothetical protein